MALAKILDSAKLIVAVGSGGVGKTTSAASIALTAARRGKKVLVLTIDPARRLANSLGLSEFGNEATKIDTTEIGEVSGELWAMMLDSRSTFDNLIHRVSPSEETRKRILNNHVYKHLSTTFAGSQDYMATEVIYDLYESGEFDLLVLDTPPVKNALDFLESPGRLVNFLDKRVLQWFLRDNKQKTSAFGKNQVVYFLLGKLFGEHFVDDLSEFFYEFEKLNEGFKLRHEAVVSLFRAPTTNFLTICAPTMASMDIAKFFLEEFRRRSLPCVGVAVNQVHTCEVPRDDAAEALASVPDSYKEEQPVVWAQLVKRLSLAHERLRALSLSERKLIDGLREDLREYKGLQLIEIPRLDSEVHDLSSLCTIGDHFI
jgi:anion-transporting  ArsA/GET3 family ATPase